MQRRSEFFREVLSHSVLTFWVRGAVRCGLLNPMVRQGALSGRRSQKGSLQWPGHFETKETV
ncbi:MAG TPA: hypothetical protein VGK77_04015, partial [Candidatus Binatia bacterium]